jgi:hypothetical protein
VVDEPQTSLARRSEQGHDEMPQHSPARPTEQGYDEMPQRSPTRPTEHDEMPQHSLARPTEQGHDEMPQHSPARPIEQGHEVMPQPCPIEQGPKQGLPSEKEVERAPVSEARKKIPIHTRPMFESMKTVPLIDKWFARDQYKPENQVKDVYARASEPLDTSKLHQPVKKYPSVEDIKWTNDCPKKYVRGKKFLPNRIMQCMPIGMRKFHDWYLRAQSTGLNDIKAAFSEYTFGGAAGKILFDFQDMQECFHLGMMEMGLVRLWCL